MGRFYYLQITPIREKQKRYASPKFRNSIPGCDSQNSFLRQWSLLSSCLSLQRRWPKKIYIYITSREITKVLMLQNSIET
jgi:hypothetical protein